jgi:hypothetical protein
MAWFDPRAVAHRRKMFTRHDAWRWPPHGSPAAKVLGWADPSATRVRLKEAREEEARAQEGAAQEELEGELLHIRWELKKLKLEYELECFREKYRVNPGQQVGVKYDGQPRTELGRFDFGKKPESGSQPADEDEEESASATPEEIVATAKRENLAARPDKYMKCLELCYPLLERRKPPGSDINTFDFHKCMAACLARKPL